MPDITPVEGLNDKPFGRFDTDRAGLVLVAETVIVYEKGCPTVAVTDKMELVICGMRHWPGAGTTLTLTVDVAVPLSPVQTRV